MTTANDSILVTPGSGATVATHSVGSKEHQVVMVANEEGQILGMTGDAYVYNIASQVHVNTANTTHWELYNGHATSLVTVLSVKQIPNITTAVTGIVFDWRLVRTVSPAGSGGTIITAWLPDTLQTALPGSIVCRTKPTGISETTTLLNYSINSEETNTSTIDIATKGGLELIPTPLQPAAGRSGILLRPGQGLAAIQATTSAAGNTGWVITFTVTA